MFKWQRSISWLIRFIADNTFITMKITFNTLYWWLKITLYTGTTQKISWSTQFSYSGKVIWTLKNMELDFLDAACSGSQGSSYPDSKVYGANMGPTWGRQDPGGPHVAPINLAIRVLVNPAPKGKVHLMIYDHGFVILWSAVVNSLRSSAAYMCQQTGSPLIQATNHCLNQCWYSSISPYGVTRPQWVKTQIIQTTN